MHMQYTVELVLNGHPLRLRKWPLDVGWPFKAGPIQNLTAYLMPLLKVYNICELLKTLFINLNRNKGNKIPQNSLMPNL